MQEEYQHIVLAQLRESSRHLAETARGVVAIIDQFDRRCARAQYTDTGAVWQLLYAIRKQLREWRPPARRLPQYDAIEVQALLRTDDDDYLPSTRSIANTFSVYWHLIEGGVSCIADAATAADALQFAEALAIATGLEVHNYMA